LEPAEIHGPPAHGAVGFRTLAVPRLDAALAEDVPAGQLAEAPGLAIAD